MFFPEFSVHQKKERTTSHCKSLPNATPANAGPTSGGLMKVLENHPAQRELSYYQKASKDSLRLVLALISNRFAIGPGDHLGDDAHRITLAAQFD